MSTAKQAENTLGEGFLTASDLLVNGSWKQFVLTIAEVIPADTLKCANKQLVDRPVLKFSNAKKMFAVSKTNAKLLKCQLGVDVCGDDASSAIGQKVTLYPVVGNWLGIKDLLGIRCRIDRDKPKPMIAKRDMGRDITNTNLQLEHVEVNDA